MHTAQKILAIPLDAPQRLFPRNAAKAETVWRNLAKAWHPDRATNPQADAVFTHLNALKQRASEWRDAGQWDEGDALILRGKDGKTRRLRYLKREATDTGETLIARTAVSHLTEIAQIDLALRAKRTIANLAFASGQMADEMQPWLPNPIAVFETPTQHVQVLQKAPDMVRLADLITHEGGTLDARHVGWIVSGMLHVACYLEWAGIAHHAIGPDTWFVSPQRHSGALLGGWGFAAETGTRLKAAPARTVAAAPSVWKREKIATPAMDRELIKLTGREMIRDPPPALSQWLDQPPATRAMDDYAGWKDALREAFGPPRFVKLTTTPEDVYNKET